MKLVYVKDRAEWRAWLEANHHRETEIWLVYNKKGTGKASIPYNDSVEEALCFGWIDSIIKKLDESQYVRKFTPRKADSQWSSLNIRRVEKMVAAGLMTPHGMRLVEAAKASGRWEKPVDKPQLDFEPHPAFETALKQNPKARETFENLAPTYQKQYLGWIEVARREDTRQKRIKESIHLLEQGKKLGLR